MQEQKTGEEDEKEQEAEQKEWQQSQYQKTEGGVQAVRGEEDNRKREAEQKRLRIEVPGGKEQGEGTKPPVSKAPQVSEEEIKDLIE